MESLSREEKEIILDFYFRCGPDEEIDRARDLIASDARAARLYEKLELALGQLDNAKYGPCPDNLAELTVAKLSLAAESKTKPVENVKLQTLLAVEQDKTAEVERAATTRRSFWRNAVEIAAIAAMVVVAANIFFTTFSNIRQVGRRNGCAYKLGKVGAGMTMYSSAHDGSLPAVATVAGAPWWKVGSQEKENNSNTRHLWLLVKGNYVSAKDFVCPGRKKCAPVNIDPSQLVQLNDFPSRNNITFSYLIPGKTTERNTASTNVLMADLNPIFENFCAAESTASYKRKNFSKIAVGEKLLNMMSTSHRNDGQNILLGDGSVMFQESRLVSGDDIYTINGIDTYSGTEVPGDGGDIFLAP